MDKRQRRQLKWTAQRVHIIFYLTFFGFEFNLINYKSYVNCKIYD